MSLRRKTARNTNNIVMSSSSDTSEASEDSAQESDLDTPSSRRGFAAVNDMSERQTSKVNAGSFGMFNDLPLMPRTSEKGKKRKRVKEYSDYQESPEVSRRKEWRGREEVIEINDEDEGEQDLFVLENNCPASPVTVDDSLEEEERLYSSVTPDRARNTKKYLEVVSHVTTAEKSFRTTDSKLSVMTTEQKALGWKLATIDATAENKISDILRQRDEAIRIATDHAEEKIKRVRERLLAKKAQYDERLRDIAERKQRMEERVAQIKATLEVVEGKKTALEQQGGFELCSDVREVQAKGSDLRSREGEGEAWRQSLDTYASLKSTSSSFCSLELEVLGIMNPVDARDVTFHREDALGELVSAWRYSRLLSSISPIVYNDDYHDDNEQHLARLRF